MVCKDKLRDCRIVEIVKELIEKERVNRLYAFGGREEKESEHQ